MLLGRILMAKALLLVCCLISDCVDWCEMLQDNYNSQNTDCRSKSWLSNLVTYKKRNHSTSTLEY